jgi:hypothetical protein
MDARAAGSAAPNQPAIARFSVESQIGIATDLDHVPRQPRLILQIPRGLELDEAPIALLRGAADRALLADLPRAPFGAADRARMLPIALGGSAERLEVAPRAPLDAGGVYTLVLGGWARDAQGELLWPDRRGFAAELRVSGAPEAGAALLGFWPAEASAGVPTNLALAVIQFDGPLLAAEPAEADPAWEAEAPAWIEDAKGRRLSTRLRSRPCAELDFPGHSCLVLEPQTALAANTEHRIVLGEALRDASGAALGPRNVRFATGPGPDTEPPLWAIRPCEPDALAVPLGCALIDDSSVVLELALDEPVQVLVLGEHGPALSQLAADRSALFRLEDLAADRELRLSVLARDLAGQESAGELLLRTLPALPALTISEVRADPLGPEPAQEYVELWNLGAEPLDLLGYRLSDAADEEGTAIEQSLLLYPGARALLVAQGFDAAEPSDVAPPEGTPLVRMGTALGSAGLSNAGEALLLRDPLGRRISAAPARPRPEPGVCSVRVSASLRDGAEGSFALDREATCTPGL